MPVDKNLYRSQGWTPDRARQKLSEIQADPEVRAGLLDKNNPFHSRYLEERHWLFEVIAGEPAPAGSAPSPLPTAKIPELRLQEAMRHPAYMDKMSPGHAALVAEVSAARGALAGTSVSDNSVK